MSKIAVLGMGAMGSRMAIALLDAQHEVTVWNRNLEKTKPLAIKGAKTAETPYLAVKNAEFIISMVQDDSASQRIWLAKDGAIAGMSPDAIAIESSTLTVAWTKTLATELAKQDLAFLDAPVAGTRPQAETQQLIYFVGGDRAVFTQAEPILRAMGSKINYLGATGNGMTVKLAVNSLFTIQVSAIAEMIGLLNQLGLDVTKAIEVISATPVCSPAAAMAAKAMVAGQFAPLFPLHLVEKDLKYALKTSQDFGVQLPLVATTQEICHTAIQQGYGNENITAIARLYQ